MTRTSVEAVKQLDSAVRKWAATADHISRDANALVEGLVVDLEAEVRVGRKGLAAAEAALVGARGDARPSLAREVRAAEESIRLGRRALAAAKDADERARSLWRRITAAQADRVPRASQELNRKLAALADYGPGGGSSSTTSHGGGSAGVSGERSRHPYRRLAAMIGIAAADQVANALAQTADQATANLPDRIGDPLSAGAALYEEVRGGWDMYRLTPEFLAMRLHPPERR